MISILQVLLKLNSLRQKTISYLRDKYFHEFGHSIPLGNDFWVHLMESDSYDSFSEIFVQQEYSDYIPDQPLSQVIDIGAHYGYFTLWLQSLQPGKEIKSLMIEPSPKCIRSLKKMVSQQQFKGKLLFMPKAINNEDCSSTKFYDRSHMGGSIFANHENEDFVKIPTLKVNDVTEQLIPPYDLIKCDIEGTEWELLNHYTELLKKTKYFLLEWHSWHRGGGGFVQLLEKLTDINFVIIQSSGPLRAVGNKGEVGLILAKNLNLSG